MIKFKEEIEKGKKAEFQIKDDGMIVKGQRMCVSKYGELKRDLWKKHIHLLMLCIQVVLRCTGL